MASFVARGHRAAVFVGAYLGAAGVAGLVLLLARLRTSIADDARAAIFWGLGIASAAGFASGFALTASAPLAMAYGGAGVIPPTVVYTLSEAGWVIISGAGGVLLGCALLVFAAGPVLAPAWVRWTTLAAGVAAIAGFAWFPFAVVLAWAIALGIWLLASDRERAPAVTASA